MSSSSSSTPGWPDEAYLLHQGSLARLVERLAADAGEADDAVQETWLRALEVGPRANPGAWLRAVLRNVVRQRARGEARRRSRETDRARPSSAMGAAGATSATDPARIVEREAVRRRVVDALLALPEPYREALVLRYYDDLAPGAIARRTGARLETVRTRLRRGRALLRAALGSPESGEEDPRRAPALGALTLGGSLVSTKVAATVIGIGIGLGLLGIWCARSLEPPGARGESTGAREAVAVGGPPTIERDEPAPLAAGAETSAGAKAPRAPVGVHRAAGEGAGTAGLATGAAVPVRGRVVDSWGAALAAAEVRWERGEDVGDWTRVGEEGAFALADAELGEGGARVAARCAGHLAETVTPEALGVGPVVLLRTPRLRGVVLDPDGAPLGRIAWLRARQWVSPSSGPSGEWSSFDFRSDGSGAFELELEPGALAWIEARARGYAGGRSEGFPLEPDRTYTLDVRLTAGVIVTGRVVDDLTGVPVARAEVRADRNRSGETPTAVTGDDGKFRLVGVECEVVAHPELGRMASIELDASAPSYATREATRYLATWSEAGEYDFELRLVPYDGVIEGRVLRADGEPWAGAEVLALDGGAHFTVTQADADGRFELDGLARGRVVLHARAEGEAGAARVEVELDSAERRSVELRLEYDPATALAGRVTDADGSPVAGVTVQARQLLAHAEPSLMLGLDERETRTDAEGGFRFEGLIAGRYWVQLDVQREHLLAVPDGVVVEVARSAEAGPVDFALLRPCTLAGWVVTEERDPRALDVELWEAGEEGEWIATVRPSGDGSFAFEPAPPRRYRVVVRAGGLELGAREAGPESASDVAIELDR